MIKLFANKMRIQPVDQLISVYVQMQKTWRSSHIIDT